MNHQPFNYSGVKIRQMRVSIYRSRSAEVQVMVQVQKDAPAKLLIGTDLLQNQLSFCLLSKCTRVYE